ncbi:hypothetical protein Taro_053251 [Colocasia esculenta]|uniref:Uncharacterized protein n=1 Tax=Colocasia esculenta TaxID=4460 RepID=A0A843XM19_COLES|nr:hypothetical protein [Colocasia esculenta]
MTPAEPAESNTMWKQTLGTHPSRQRISRKHRSDYVRPESHDTSTNISDLHEVGKEQPGVTPRDTEQPRKKHRLTIGTATSDLHQIEVPQEELPCTSDTPRGQGKYTLRCHHGRHQGMVTETAVGCQHSTRRENPQNGKH